MKKRDGSFGIVVAIVATALVLIGAFLFIYFKFLKQDNASSEKGRLMVDTRADAAEKTTNPLSGRTIAFAGLDDAVLEKGGAIILENLPENDDFLIKYEITDVDANKQVFETDLIPAGKSITWIPSDDLEVGEHHLAFLQRPYWKDETGEYVPLTAGNNEVTITIQ